MAALVASKRVVLTAASASQNCCHQETAVSRREKDPHSKISHGNERALTRSSNASSHTSKDIEHQVERKIHAPPSYMCTHTLPVETVKTVEQAAFRWFSVGVLKLVPQVARPRRPLARDPQNRLGVQLACSHISTPENTGKKCSKAFFLRAVYNGAKYQPPTVKGPAL